MPATDGSSASTAGRGRGARARRRRCRAERERLERAGGRTAAAEAELAAAHGARAPDRSAGQRQAQGCSRAGRAGARGARRACDGGRGVRGGGRGREEAGPSGAERVELMLAPNPGVPAAPIREAASGEEALARDARADDRGRCREVANARVRRGGRRRRRPNRPGRGGAPAGAGGERQVLCITHLPQIAALAGSHFRIEKSAAGATALTTVEALDGEGVLAELVRMLGAEEADGAAPARRGAACGCLRLPSALRVDSISQSRRCPKAARKPVYLRHRRRRLRTREGHRYCLAWPASRGARALGDDPESSIRTSTSTQGR